jgi:Tfp pilus assembly protein PilN
MKAVNLLPRDRTTAKTRTGLGPIPLRLLGPVLGIVVLAVTVALGVAVWTTNSDVASKQQQLNALQSRIAQLPPSPAAGIATAAPPRKTALVALAGARLPWDGFLGAFARVVPENVWLTALTANSPGAGPTVAADEAADLAAAQAASGDTSSASSSSSSSGSASTQPASAPLASSSPSTFTISGYTYSQPSVARLMRRLELIPWLANINLVSSAKTLLGNASVVQFTVGANVVPLTEPTS